MFAAGRALPTINLVLQILMMMSLTFGAVLARRKHYRAHQYVQTPVVILNLFLIALVMVVTFVEQIVPALGSGTPGAQYRVGLVHAFLGTVGEALGIYVLLRMNRIIPSRYRFKNIRLLMRTTYTWWMLTAILGIITYVLFSGSSAPDISTLTSQPQKAGELSIPMANFAYVPGQVTIPVGTKVKWLNLDAAPHTVTADDTSFDSGFKAKDGVFERSFTSLGRFPYFCTFHGDKGGQGMAGVIVVSADVAQVPVSLAAPTPTAQPPPPPPPAGYYRQPAGILAFVDRFSASDAVRLEMVGIAQPPANTAYELWLTAKDGARRSAGKLTLGTGSGNLSSDYGESKGQQPVPTTTTTDTSLSYEYVSPERENLMAKFDGLEITVEPQPDPDPNPSGQVAFTGQLPVTALRSIRKLMAVYDQAPQQNGLMIGLFQGSQNLLRLAHSARDAAGRGDVAVMRRRGEQMVTLLEGKQGSDYRDLDGNGRVEDPGDGFGMLDPGNGGGYLSTAATIGREARTAPDADEAVKAHMGHLLVSLENIRPQYARIRDLALSMAQAQPAGDPSATADELSRLVETAFNGVDANGDGVIAPVSGEAGVITGYDHAQYSAAIAVFSK